MPLKHKTLPPGTDRPGFTGITPSLYAEEHSFSGGTHGSVLTRNTGNSDGAGWVASGSGVLICTGAGVLPSFSTTLPNAVQDNITRAGTITSGIWNAGAVTSSSDVTDSVSTMATLRLALAKEICQGRLTLETAVPVSTTDQSAKTSLFFTPYNGNSIGLYTGSIWKTYTFSELTLSLSGLTASKPYDIFVYDNSGTVTLEGLVWTNTTTRATGLVLQDGVYVKSGATTRRYVGTIYINATGGQSDDTYAKRYVWNAYNRVTRPMRRVETTASWTYDSTSFHQVNASTANQLDFVVGLPDVFVNARAASIAQSGGSTGWAVAIGLDSTTTMATGCISTENGAVGAADHVAVAFLSTYSGIGRHTLVWLEAGDGATTTWQGVTAGRNQTGIDGWLEA